MAVSHDGLKVDQLRANLILPFTIFVVVIE